ncbi:putative nicotinamide mononucleotide transmembrane transporter protein [Podospora appendiculata]|uniref:Nicotinamide mononucleotide transmembrane transporter protein n=1 Tax=Podospora appendiculata TaxID=314037 RepID=A0AAE0X6Q4_9PEZI|nr:putative nicotinamide mononucleotide transmembrane transporter protein [Podospora appendiculata]
MGYSSGEVSAPDVPPTETSSVNEKIAVKEAENSLSDTEAAAWDEPATKRLLRKIDRMLIPFLSLLYLLSFLDRTNIGNARLDTLEADLHLDKLKIQYNDALAIFFPFYVAAEIPSNMAMKRFRPSLWIPSIMVAWGICTTLMGIVNSYGGLLAVRCALGIAEGGLFPGITYYITMWYRRHECGFRMAIFFSAATAAGAFGGLLARGIVEMGPKYEEVSPGKKAVPEVLLRPAIGGLSGWRWIFILEGILTVVIAIIAYWAMQDYPATAKFLKEDERAEVQARLKRDRSSLADEFDMKYFWAALTDWKIWVHMFITFFVYTGLYSYSLFLPTIINSLGFTTPNTVQLLTVPPYIVACICCITAGWYADKVGHRGLFMIFFMGIASIGLIMLMATSNAGVRYTGCFFLAAGIYPNVPQGVAWNGNNIGGSLKRGVGIAMHVGFGNLGGTLSSYLFLAKDNPTGKYYSGFGTLLAFQVAAAILSTFMTIYLRRENVRRDAVHKPPHEYSEDERVNEREKGDNASFFRYTV